MYAEKTEFINNLTNKNSSKILHKLNKFLGKNEFKSQIDEIIKIINNKIANSEESNLQELSEYYFKLSGKMFRPYIIITISKYLYECINNNSQDYFESTIHNKYILPYAACIEVLHNASLLQDDIIDNSDQRRNYKTAHNIFGIRNTVFGANYIISKAANLITELEIEHLNEIYSGIVYNLTAGECQQSLKKIHLDNIDKSFQIYMTKTYYKTASLIAQSIRGVGIIYNFDEYIQKQLFNLGLHIGIVFQLIDDVMDVLYDSSKTKKPSLKDLKEGLINGHILFEIQDDKNKTVLELARRKFKGEDDIQKILDILNKGKGILKTQNLALDHLLEAIKILNTPFFIENSTKVNLLQCFKFLMMRNY
jgi:geranylgeranyl pyrophosphate synthase